MTYKKLIDLNAKKIKLVRECIYDNKTAAKKLRQYADEIEKGDNTKHLFSLVGELFGLTKRTIYRYLNDY